MQAELWGDEQWSSLKSLLQEKDPKVIGVDISTVTAFSDGLSAGELEGMRAGVGPALASRFKPAGDLPVELIATRLPEEGEFYRRMQQVVWGIIDTAFSNLVITPGTTRT